MTLQPLPSTREELIASGQSLLKQNQFLSALTAFERAAEMGPPLENLQLLIAFSAAHAGVFEKVLPSLEKERTTFPQSQATHSFLSDIEADCSRNACFKSEFSEGGRYLLAGLSPDSSGTGRFLEALLPIAEGRGYRKIHPNMGGRFGLAERIRLSGISGSSLLLLHPQTIGWPLVRTLLRNRNRVGMYVLDNSFFCVRSYNYREGNLGECLDCVGNLSRCHASCEPFPSGAAKQETLGSMQALLEHSPHLTFFCQSEAQKKLILAHFGAQTEAHVVGMKTAELVSLVGTPPFDVVYHAEEHPAKGFWYTIELARRLPELRFLVPSAREDLEKRLGRQDWPSNITFKAMRWESGLDREVRRARMVLCPSLWSAAIEGAVLKSLHENGNVALVGSEFGFSSELPSDLVLHLATEAEHGAAQLREALALPSRSAKAKSWGAQYLSSVRLEHIFDILDSKQRARV
jgi:hypothetical protein